MKKAEGYFVGFKDRPAFFGAGFVGVKSYTYREAMREAKCAPFQPTVVYKLVMVKTFKKRRAK